MHVAILGNGVTGITTARELRKREPGCKITVISGESEHHYSRPALMYLFMGHMGYRELKPYEDWFWAQNRIDLVHAWVQRIDVRKKQLELDRGAPIAYDKLVLATGAVTAKYDWPGQDLKGVQGLVTLQDVETLEQNVRHARRAVIVGGGLIGIELAEMLHTRGIHVTFLVREKSYWARILPPEESAMVNRVIHGEGVALQLGTELKEIVDDGTGRVGAVVTSKGERLECQIVGITTGVKPNVALAEASGLPVKRGILVDEALRTALPDVFAAGDCAEIVGRDGKSRVEQLWYTGKLQGELLARVLAGENASYDRGIWFNSAKFFDLEYQTYGFVNMHLPGEKSLYFEADDGLHALRLVYDDERILGFNTMGVRWRQRTCERWIRERRDVRYVLEHLDQANFDPEFFRRHEQDLRRSWKEQVA